MLRLSKKVEYAILALQFISNKDDKFATAKEISDSLEIPFEFLSKSLQTLMKKGILESQLGVRGGYQLARSPNKITIQEVIVALEGRSGLVDCTYKKSNETCDKIETCLLKNPMAVLQNRINSIFKQTTIAQLSGEVKN